MDITPTIGNAGRQDESCQKATVSLRTPQLTYLTAEYHCGAAASRYSETGILCIALVPTNVKCRPAVEQPAN